MSQLLSKLAPQNIAVIANGQARSTRGSSATGLRLGVAQKTSLPEGVWTCRVICPFTPRREGEAT